MSPSVTTQTGYTYDGTGLLASRTTATGTQPFSWDEAQGTPLILSDGTNSYLYGPGGVPIEQISSTGPVDYLAQDALGSTRLITDSSGSVVGTTSYSPYGQVTAQSGTVTTPFGFAGQYTDSQTGLVYMRARWYDPGTGQFLSQDPLWPMTVPYAYADGNPLNVVDPLGLCGCPFEGYGQFHYGVSYGCSTGNTPGANGFLTRWGHNVSGSLEFNVVGDIVDVKLLAAWRLGKLSGSEDLAAFGEYGAYFGPGVALGATIYQDFNSGYPQSEEWGRTAVDVGLTVGLTLFGAVVGGGPIGAAIGGYVGVLAADAVDAAFWMH